MRLWWWGVIPPFRLTQEISVCTTDVKQVESFFVSVMRRWLMLANQAALQGIWVTMQNLSVSVRGDCWAGWKHGWVWATVRGKITDEITVSSYRVVKLLNENTNLMSFCWWRPPTQLTAYFSILTIYYTSTHTHEWDLHSRIHQSDPLSHTHRNKFCSLLLFPTCTADSSRGRRRGCSVWVGVGGIWVDEGGGGRRDSCCVQLP